MLVLCPWGFFEGVVLLLVSLEVLYVIQKYPKLLPKVAKMAPKIAVLALF